MNRKKNGKHIEKVTNELTEIVGALETDKFRTFIFLTEEYLKERKGKFGENPDFSKMKIRDKIYPGMYFYNLLIADMITTHRWEYWMDLIYTKDLSKDIPYIDFIDESSEKGHDVKTMLKNCIEVNYCGGAGNFISFVRYLLYSLKPINHFEGNSIEEKESNAAMLINGISDEILQHFYENFSLESLLLYPSDYLGDLAAIYLGDNGSAYFPTPMVIAKFMHEVTVSDSKNTKFETVMDPCTGSSRMLLCASNNYLRLYGCDINQNIVEVSLVNGYLYVPWMIYMPKEIDLLLDNQSVKIKNDNSNDKLDLYKAVVNGQLTFF